MRKFVLLVVVLIMVIAFAGCQQSGLTEEDIRNIVQEEVAQQIATGQLKDIIGQEITKQLSNINELTLSKLYIKDNGQTFAYLGPDQYGNKPVLDLYVGDKIAVELGSSVHGDGFLFLFSGENSGQAFIGKVAAGFGMYFHNRFGEQIFALDTDSDGNGSFRIHNKYGEVTFVAP